MHLRQYKGEVQGMSGVTGGQPEEIEMFSFSLFLYLGGHAKGSFRTQKLWCKKMHLSCLLGLFRNLTVVSSRMELNFEPNSSVLSCARVRGEKNRQNNAEKR